MFAKVTLLVVLLTTVTPSVATCKKYWNNHCASMCVNSEPCIISTMSEADIDAELEQELLDAGAVLQTGTSEEYCAYDYCMNEMNDINNCDGDPMWDLFLFAQDRTTSLPDCYSDPCFDQFYGECRSYCGSSTFEFCYIIPDSVSTPSLLTRANDLYIDLEVNTTSYCSFINCMDVVKDTCTNDEFFELYYDIIDASATAQATDCTGAVPVPTSLNCLDYWWNECYTLCPVTSPECFIVADDPGSALKTEASPFEVVIDSSKYCEYLSCMVPAMGICSDVDPMYITYEKMVAVQSFTCPTVPSPSPVSSPNPVPVNTPIPLPAKCYSLLSDISLDFGCQSDCIFYPPSSYVITDPPPASVTAQNATWEQFCRWLHDFYDYMPPNVCVGCVNCQAHPVWDYMVQQVGDVVPYQCASITYPTDTSSPTNVYPTGQPNGWQVPTDTPTTVPTTMPTAVPTEVPTAETIEFCNEVAANISAAAGCSSVCVRLPHESNTLPPAGVVVDVVGQKEFCNWYTAIAEYLPSGCHCTNTTLPCTCRYCNHHPLWVFTMSEAFTAYTCQNPAPEEGQTDSNKVYLVVVIVAICVVLCCLCSVGVLVYTKRSVAKFKHHVLDDTQETDRLEMASEVGDSEGDLNSSQQQQQQGSQRSRTPSENVHILGYLNNKDYTTGTILGKGQFGTVHMILLPNSTSLARKTISATGQSDAEIQTYVQEIRNMRTLSHPNVVYCYYASYDIEAQSISIYMEYFPGGSLGKMVRSMKEPLSEVQGAIYVSQVLAGLEYLHSNGVIHRDIKGDNVMVDTSEGLCKISDFGSSKQINDPAVANAKTICGTPNWMAPEVIINEGKKSHNEKVDIWSLGALTVEVLNNGKPPWGNFDSHWTALYHIAQSKGLPDGIPEGLSKTCTSFLSLCFERNPEARPSCVALRSHLWLQRNCRPASCFTSVDSNIAIIMETKKLPSSANTSRRNSMSNSSVGPATGPSESLRSRISGMNSLQPLTAAASEGVGGFKGSSSSFGRRTSSGTTFPSLPTQQQQQEVDTVQFGTVTVASPSTLVQTEGDSMAFSGARPPNDGCDTVRFGTVRSDFDTNQPTASTITVTITDSDIPSFKPFHSESPDDDDNVQLATLQHNVTEFQMAD